MTFKRSSYVLVSTFVILALSFGMVRTLYAAMERVPLRKYTEPAIINSVWDWENPAEKSARDHGDTALFLYQHQINTSFLDISSVLASNADQQSLDESFSSYIKAMSRRKIGVYAAGGHTDWSKPQQRWQPERIMDFVYGYNQRHPEA